jgi:hypothetical protein
MRRGKAKDKIRKHPLFIPPLPVNGQTCIAWLLYRVKWPAFGGGGPRD